MDRSGDRPGRAVCVGRTDIQTSHLARAGRFHQRSRFLARLDSTRFFREGKSRMVQRQQQSMGEPSEREHYSLYCWIYLQGSA
jgi:hypothetical protein